MNIYFEYRYLLDTVQKNRNKETGDVSLLNLLKDLLETANECLGGINKLTTRIVDDNRLEIYDQNPIYGTQSEAPKTSIFNLYGVKPNNGSFVRNFSIQTELTNEFATQVTIGAQAQGSKDTTDALALSNWNYGLIDRIIPEKLSSSEFKKPKTASTLENIINVRNQLILMWCAYAEGTKRLDILRPDLTEQQIDDLQKYIELQSGIPEEDRFFDTATDFQLEDTNVTEKKGYYFRHFPTKRYSEFVKLQKDFFALLHINSDYNSNQQGMLPINISVELDGLSGIRIYDQLPVDTRFIPNYYPQTLYWIIKGVSHSITDNRWITKLETIAVPKIPPLDSDKSSTKSTKVEGSTYIHIPWTGINGINESSYRFNDPPTGDGSPGGGTGGGGTGQTGGGGGVYGAPHINPTTDTQKQLKQEFLQKMLGFTQPTTCAWVPLIDSNTAASRKISVTSFPQAGRFNRNHYGADFGCPVGTQVLAPCDGVWVVLASVQSPSSTAGAFGAIKQTLSDGTVYYHTMMHLSQINLATNTPVKAGDVVALSGGAVGVPSSGRSGGPHLHYEIRINTTGGGNRYSVVDWLNSNPPAPGCQLLTGTGTSNNTSNSGTSSTSSSSGNSGSTTPESKTAFYSIVNKIKNIFELKDSQGANGTKLFEPFKGTFDDDEKGALEAFKTWFAKQTSDYNKLSARDKTELNSIISSIEGNIGSFTTLTVKLEEQDNAILISLNF